MVKTTQQVCITVIFDLLFLFNLVFFGCLALDLWILIFKLFINLAVTEN